VLLYCLQAGSELFMEVAGYVTLFCPKAVFYLVVRFYVKAILGVYVLLHLFVLFYSTNPLFPFLLPLKPISEN